MSHLTILDKSFPHHSKQSGYTKYLEYSKYKRNRIGIDFFQKLNIKERLFNRLPFFKIDYNNLLIAKLLKYTKKHKSQIVHITYLEDMAFIPYQGCKRIITVHQPIAQQLLFPYYVKNLHESDSIVVVSTEPIPFFKQFTADVTFIPHGVDTSYFKKDNQIEKASKLQCITCGAHLRDYSTLLQIIKMADKLKLPINFVVVYPERALAFNPYLYNLFTEMQRYQSVQLKISVTDEELLKLYQTSHIGLMPLFDSTANNALLEMAACGLTIITTDLIGTRDYLNESFTHFIQHNNVEEIIEQLKQYINQRNVLAEKENIASSYMQENFDFKIIANMYDAYYNKKLAE